MTNDRWKHQCIDTVLYGQSIEEDNHFSGNKISKVTNYYTVEQQN